MTPDHRVDHIDPQTLADYLERTRWFGGKGRPYAVTGVRVVGEVPGAVLDGPRVLIHLVEVTYADGPADGTAEAELYQVPLVFYTEPETRLDH
ncbi:MAG: hypothetical protein F2667_11805, partial [Actinobacteria bacterium]|nr:hypothetical protein [Actinomycetota bacterium]